MSFIWTAQGGYRRVRYRDEADFEAAVLQVQADLFGPDRVYLDIKKRIGVRGVQENVPDGYVLDLSGTQPRLYVVENELAEHDPLRHIAVQLLQFSLSFEAERRRVRTVLFDAIQQLADIKTKCEKYVGERGFRNLDHLLDHLVHEVPFTALVIIDEAPASLENALTRRFKFPVDVLELARYENDAGQRIYRFEPFLSEAAADLVAASAAFGARPQVDLSDIDTVVVPAHKDGFEEVFLGENRWYAIHIAAALRPQIKYIAAYQVSPESAITYLAPVKSIEPWQDSGKYVVNFAESAKKIEPIRLLKNGRVTAPQSRRYTTLSRLRSAKSLDDLWAASDTVADREK
jgi:hypothetical protein